MIVLRNGQLPKGPLLPIFCPLYCCLPLVIFRRNIFYEKKIICSLKTFFCSEMPIPREHDHVWKKKLTQKCFSGHEK